MESKRKISTIAIVDVNNVNNEYGDISGSLIFIQLSGHTVRITGVVNGLSDGKHGVNIHQKNALCENNGHCPHFRTNKTSRHGSPLDRNRHAGDLGNISSVNGVARVFVEVSDLYIGTKSGKNSILNRLLVVHADEDDLGMGDNTESLETGNSGEVIAVGLIHSI